MTAVWIGTSGWSYDHWQGVLYPSGLPPRDRLSRYVREYSAVELNSSYYRWPRDAVFGLLERYGAAYCVMSGAHLPCILRATADVVYVRMHGPDPRHLYAGSYSDDDLRWWADRIGEWRLQGREVHVYFNNDGEGHAVRNAAKLKGLLGA